MLDSLYDQWFDLIAGSWGNPDPVRDQQRAVVSAQIDALETAAAAQRQAEQQARTARIREAKARIETLTLELRRAA